LTERIRKGFPLNAASVGDFVVSVERSGLPIIKTGRMVDAGSLIETNNLIRAGKLRVALPLFGFSQKLSQGEMGRIEERVLEAEGAERKDFRVAEIPRISGKGELRTVVSPVRDYRVDNVSVVESAGEVQVKLGFMLLRGSYATMLLREVMKPRDPIAAGF
jgi:tRNA pseudouridine13 synthase